ncbi:WD40 repeat domain-containing protein [Aspergillus stella-maris]|uniref:WD40 repeat domain-containing protein n=1 Tax=Aspergillus stella-maris TaxID=1810926 RepID=UPI003CCD66A1
MNDPCKTFTYGDYTIGWICALLESKLVAAMAMLDKKYPGLLLINPHDLNLYVLGRIGNHNIVIACLPAETTGKVFATTVAKDMVRSFLVVRFGLMVGIGVKETEDSEDAEELDNNLEDIRDIQLGDMYDFGKLLQEREFILSGGRLKKPPSIILGADYLFEPEFVHQAGKKTCRPCRSLEGNLMERVDQVMKDALLRDRWAREKSIVCFEIEAAGLIDLFPCLNKVWQPYAAATAACYAKELLHVILGQGVISMDLVKQIKKSLNKVRDCVKDTSAVSKIFDKLPYIVQWAEDPSLKCIFWLNGMAGTGNFFFKRGEGGRDTTKNFFTTICKQLLLHIPALFYHVKLVINTDPLILDKPIKEQHLQIFITSRPELLICPVFKQMVKEDIQVFLKDEFSRIKASQEVSSKWLEDDVLETLVKRAVPLFISAFTICRFVDNPTWLLEDRLLTLLEDPIATSILKQLFSNADNREKKQLEQEFQDTLGVITLLIALLLVNALAQLTNKSLRNISNHLNRFYSVLSVPKNHDSPVWLLHLSFQDYLLTTEESSFHQSKSHVLKPEVFPFLEKHFLHWLEALSLMDAIFKAVGIINMLQQALSISLCTMFSNSRHERIRIIPQVEDYWSPGLQTLEGHSDWILSVAFSHDSQMVASGSYNDNTVKLWDAKTGLELQTLKGHSHSILSVAFSHDDSQMVASGSNDNTVKLWDAKTGLELQTLKGHSNSGLSVASTPHAEKHHHNYNIQVSVSDNWVMVAGENILWLPPEHRQFTASAATEATLALGYSDGRVSII